MKTRNLRYYMVAGAIAIAALTGGCSASSNSPTLVPSASPSGTIGDAFTVADSEGHAYQVTATRVLQQATGADEYTLPAPGQHFAGVAFTVTGKTGTSSDNANFEATVRGSNGKTYTCDMNNIAGYVNFNDGSFAVPPGRSQTGAVAFALPNGVTIASVLWGNPLTDSIITWKVS